MRNIRLGYGSEYQLLRFLGYHRNELDDRIQEVTGSNEPIRWLDYPRKEGTSYQDREYKNVEVFRDEPNYQAIQKAWKRVWPSRGNSQNWDGVFKQGDIWYIVEAKANNKEVYQTCKAKPHGGYSQILRAFVETCNGNTELAQRWIDSNCYQLANRMAFIHFCQTHNIEVRLCLICFIYGYNNDNRIEVESMDQWIRIWNEEYDTLSLTDEQKNCIKQVFINCKN